jgi:hypothetical protein
LPLLAAGDVVGSGPSSALMSTLGDCKQQTEQRTEQQNSSGAPAIIAGLSETVPHAQTDWQRAQQRKQCP